MTTQATRPNLLAPRELVRVLCIFLLAGCSTHPISLRTNPRAYTPDDYEAVYEAWTRDADRFSWGELDEALRVSATYESTDFRTAYVARYANDHSLTPENRDTILDATLADARAHHRFFVTVAGDVWAEQNLASERSAWRVLLVTEEGEMHVPASVARVRRPSAAERTYFPTATVHRQAFRISFPTEVDGREVIPESASHFVLRFTGALGRVDLRWEFESDR